MIILNKFSIYCASFETCKFRSFYCTLPIDFTDLECSMCPLHSRGEKRERSNKLGSYKFCVCRVDSCVVVAYITHTKDISWTFIQQMPDSG